jgi:replicative DNA helicase
MFLGCVFLEQSLMPPVLERLTVGDFFSPIHQTVFRAFKNMLQTRTDFNPVTLEHEVRRLAEAGHGAMIEPSGSSELYDGVPRF